MIEDRYLQIFLSPNDLGPNIKKIIMTKLKEKYLYREIDGKMITDIRLINYNDIPLSNNLELNILANVTYKIYKPGDIINGEIFSNDGDDRVFVISHDIICENLNTDILPKIKSKNHIKIRLKNIKSTNGCMYFLADGDIFI